MQEKDFSGIFEACTGCSFSFLPMLNKFSDWGMTIPMMGLKYGFQGTLNTKNLLKNSFASFDEGLACSL